MNEGWVDKMKEQNTEGCRIAGQVRVNKVNNGLYLINETDDRLLETCTSVRANRIRTTCRPTKSSYVAV